jgi:transcriptional regulator with XRE-family HTH domain
VDPSPLTEHFVARVLAEAERQGMSINRLADFAGLSRGYVSELLRVQKVPTLTTVEKLAEALQVTPCELLCRDSQD